MRPSSTPAAEPDPARTPPASARRSRPPWSRIVLALKAASLARGASGVREGVIDTLLAVHDAGLAARVPSQGSVGASRRSGAAGAPGLPLLGEGEVLPPTAGAFPPPRHCARRGIAPLRLAAKEGLALINGTQVSTALALHALFDASAPVLDAALVVGALTVDALRGTDAAVRSAHPSPARPARADRRRAATYRALLEGSAIRDSHLTGDDRVQDPYSLRCQPQVVGACLDSLRHVGAGAAARGQRGDRQPARLPTMSIVSGGNFHAEPVALACDACALAIAEVGAIAERRIAMLIDSAVSRLPPFLGADAGLNRGFMIAHVTAAALASENKSLAHPASVDSLPTSANQEDHVSMATFAARRLQPMIANTAHILGIELLAAAQGIDFLRPLTSSPALEAAHALVRDVCPPLGEDRYLAPDIEHATGLVGDGSLARLLRALPGLPALWIPA